MLQSRRVAVALKGQLQGCSPLFISDASTFVSRRIEAALRESRPLGAILLLAAAAELRIRVPAALLECCGAAVSGEAHAGLRCLYWAACARLMRHRLLRAD